MIKYRLRSWGGGCWFVVVVVFSVNNSFRDCMSAAQIYPNSPASLVITIKNENSFILLGFDQDQKQESGIHYPILICWLALEHV